jgi:methylamine dehydrogenase accessory protein MauD
LETGLLLLRLVLAGAFVVAAAGKLLGPAAWRDAVRDFGVPSRLQAPVSAALPLLEFGVAGGLVVAASAAWAAVGAAILLLIFGVAMVRLMVRGEAPDCRCFGTLGESQVGRATLARNAVLLALAVFVAVAGWRDAGASLGLVGAAVLAAGILTAAQMAFLWQLFQQNGRLLARVAALETSPVALNVEQVEEASPAVGEPAPGFALPDVDGRTVSLDELLSAGRGVVLVFSDPGCGHCEPLLPVLGRRDEDDVPVAVVSRGRRDDNRARAEEHGIEHMLLQDDFEVADAYGVYGLPGAVVIDEDGRIASARAAGAAAVAELLNRSGSATGTLIQVEGRP